MVGGRGLAELVLRPGEGELVICTDNMFLFLWDFV